jgi:hypothetical protein
MSTAQKYFMMEIIPNFTVAVSNSLEICFTKITKLQVPIITGLQIILYLEQPMEIQLFAWKMTQEHFNEIKLG